MPREASAVAGEEASARSSVASVVAGEEGARRVVASEWLRRLEVGVDAGE